MAKKKTSAVRKKNSKKIIAGAIGAAAVIGVGGYELGAAQNQDIQDFEPVYTVSESELARAKKDVSALKLRSGSNPAPDYDSASMPGWADTDGDGCPTRYDILVRDLQNEKNGDKKCTIKSGTLFDYYTGNLVKYNRRVSGGGIDIDHIVAKGNAWESGGYAWSNEAWRQYVNDEDVLIATSSKANRQKGDKDASEWLPQNEDYWCKYVIKQIDIKKKYGLSITKAEKTAILDILKTDCIVE